MKFSIKNIRKSLHYISHGKLQITLTFKKLIIEIIDSAKTSIIKFQHPVYIERMTVITFVLRVVDLDLTIFVDYAVLLSAT